METASAPPPSSQGLRASQKTAADVQQTGRTDFWRRTLSERLNDAVQELGRQYRSVVQRRPTITEADGRRVEMIPEPLQADFARTVDQLSARVDTQSADAWR